MDTNYSAILQERKNILHLNNLYVLRRCMQVAILFKILTCQPTWYIREVYSGLPERPEIVRLRNRACRRDPRICDKALSRHAMQQLSRNGLLGFVDWRNGKPRGDKTVSGMWQIQWHFRCWSWWLKMLVNSLRIIHGCLRQFYASSLHSDDMVLQAVEEYLRREEEEVADFVQEAFIFSEPGQICLGS